MTAIEILKTGRTLNPSARCRTMRLSAFRPLSETANARTRDPLRSAAVREGRVAPELVESGLPFQQRPAQPAQKSKDQAVLNGRNVRVEYSLLVPQSPQQPCHFLLRLFQVGDELLHARNKSQQIFGSSLTPLDSVMEVVKSILSVGVGVTSTHATFRIHPPWHRRTP